MAQDMAKGRCGMWVLVILGILFAWYLVATVGWIAWVVFAIDAVVLGFLAFGDRVPALRRTAAASERSTSASTPSYGYTPPSGRPVFSEAMAARRHELAQYTDGRHNAELHRLNVDKTNSMSADELRRTKAEREAQGKPTTQIDAALRERGELGRSWIDEVVH